MMSLRQSLKELLDASANKLLTDSGTLEEQQEVARMAMLISMLDQIESDGGSWENCGLLPEPVPLQSALQRSAGRPQ